MVRYIINEIINILKNIICIISVILSRVGHFWLNCFTYKYTPYFWHELSGLKLFVIYVGIKYLFKWLWYILPQVIFIHIYDVYNYYILDLRVKNMGFKPQISTLFWVKIKNLLTTDVLPRNELIKCSIKSFCQKPPFSSNFYCASRVGQFLTQYSTFWRHWVHNFWRILGIFQILVAKAIGW